MKTTAYKPTTEVVRNVYTMPCVFPARDDEAAAGEAFDAWLEEVRAEAWDEGRLMGGRSPMFQNWNPYKQA